VTVLDRARELAPAIRDAAQEGEAQRTMPAELVERLRAAGLFHLAMPTGLGGPPEEPETIVKVIEEVSVADGSAGWTVLIGNATFFVAWLESDVAKEILAERPDMVVASSFAPTGQAVPNADGALRVSGRWTFTSGAPHADWFANGVLVMDGDAPRMVGDRVDWRFAWMPASEIEVVDTWRAAGLRGTGSHDTAAADVAVPVERTIAPLFEPARAPEPVFRLPFFSIVNLSLAGFALGTARRALDEFTALAQAKSRRFDGVRMADDETIQIEVLRLEAALRSARSYVFDAVGQLWDGVAGGDPVTLRQRAQVVAAVGQAFRSGLQVVDTAFRLAGGGALYESSPLQRCFRDLHAGSQHLALGHSVERAAGQVFLGLEPKTVFL
jgi:alkylation response protein AidB-like acyl-CoA dehydrogenase